MDCSEVRAALLGTRHRSEAELAAHAGRCSACHELLADGAVLGRLLATARQASPRVEEGQLAAAVARDLRSDQGLLGRLRGLSTGQRVALATAAALLPVFVLSIDNPRALIVERVFTAAYAMLVALAIASLLAPLSRLRRNARQVMLAALVFGVPTSLLMLISRTTAPATNETLGCFATGLLSSAPVFALLHVLSRRPRFSFSELALLGAITGVSANMALGMYCVDHRLVHLIAGHAVSGFLWIACSWLAVRKVAQQIRA
jgi:hypothetical protein